MSLQDYTPAQEKDAQIEMVIDALTSHLSVYESLRKKIRNQRMVINKMAELIKHERGKSMALKQELDYLMERLADDADSNSTKPNRPDRNHGVG
jgi:hypothetical protein